MAPDRLGREAAHLLRHGTTIGLSYLGAYAIVFTDSVMVAWLGTAEFTGVSLGVLYYAVPLLFGMGCTYVVAPQVAEALGRGRRLRSRLVGIESIMLAAVFSILAIPLVYFGSIPLAVFGGSVEFIEYTSTYLSIVCFAFVFQVLSVTVGQICVGHGKSHIILYESILAFFVNILLNYLLIFVLDFGVAGVAVSTVATSLLALGFTTFMARRIVAGGGIPPLRHRLRKALRGRLVRLSLPLGFLEVLLFFLFSQTTVLIGLASPGHLPAHLIVFQVGEGVALFFIGYGDAVAARIAFYKGRGDRGGMRRLVALACVLTGMIGLACALAMWTGSDRIFDFYAQGKPDFARAKPVFDLLVPLGALLMAIDSIHVILICSLRGLGDTRYLTTMSAICMGSVGLGGGAVAINTFPGGAIWVWLCLDAAVLLVTAMAYLRFRRIVPGPAR